MERFTYTRTGTALKNHLLALGMIASVDLVAWLVAFYLVPPPWGVRLLVGGSLLTLALCWVLTSPLRTSHELTCTTCHLKMGRHRLTIARSEILQVKAIQEALPRGIKSAGVGYWASSDTLYMLANQKGLVSLALAQPYELKVPDHGLCQFTRVVLSLDEPGRFLAALEGQEGLVPTGRVGPERALLVAHSQAGQEADHPWADEGEALILRGLEKRFGDFTAVRGVDLAIRPGEVLALLGSNGAGKSTIIRMVTGLIRPTAGQVLVEGRDLWVEGGPVRRLVGYVPDVPLLYESLTAREFLWLMAGLYGLPEPEGRQRAEELLALVKLERWADHQLRSFSLGMKRKMAIAAALVHRPRVLLLDEVTNGLDPRAAREVKDSILEMARDGAAVLLTTHILEVAEEVAHRIAIVHEGEIRALGSLAELREQAGLAEATLEQLFLALTAERQVEVGA